MKYLTDQLQLVFLFALATQNSYILFLFCNFTTCYTVLLTEPSITISSEERELACFVYLCHHPRSQFISLFTQAIFIWPYHCSYIFVTCLAFRVHAAGDLNKPISFVVAVLSTSFARALLGLIR